jgi:hypothetical protein
MALPLALLALVVIAGLVAGGFAWSLLEQRIGRNALYAVQAAAAAETGAAEVVGSWVGNGLDLLAPGDSAVLPEVLLPGHAAYRATVSRLNPELYLVRVAGVRADAEGGELARRVLGLVVRVADSTGPGLPPVRALADRAWTGGF